jgi:hypothetical protein
MWVSDVLPGNVNDLSAARKHVLAVLRPFVEADARPGRCWVRGSRSRRPHLGEETASMKELVINSRTRNALIRPRRCPGERGWMA